MEVNFFTPSLCLAIVLFCHNVTSKSSETETEEDKQDLGFAAADYNETIPTIVHWSRGVVRYFIDSNNYDEIVKKRIRTAMETIQKTSCVVFKELKKPRSAKTKFTWLSIENPHGVRECSHNVLVGPTGKKTFLILGYDCMQPRDILHALLHALGFRDEVTHPQRDMYIRVIWTNILPKYRPLFWMRTEDPPHRLVEYDTMSVMHFHDRQYTSNGAPTIAPMIPGLLINPSDNLSQLDAMKLRLAFDQECNKRKVGKLFKTCLMEQQEGDRYDAGENDDNANDDNGDQENDKGDEVDDNGDEDVDKGDEDVDKGDENVDKGDEVDEGDDNGNDDNPTKKSTELKFAEIARAGIENKLPTDTDRNDVLTP